MRTLLSLVCLIGCYDILTAGEETSGHRDVKPRGNIIDPVPVLSVERALEFEAEVKKTYHRIAPTVVRLWVPSEDISALDAPSVSGVIIDPSGLILTCSHHNEAPGTKAVVQLADGKQVAGEFLGRFQVDDPRPMHFGPDVGLARITEPGQWPATVVHDGEAPVDAQPCLAIGYPGTLALGRPPLLRIGRITPGFPEVPWLQTTTSIYPGDSGGPLFDFAGQVVGIASHGDNVGPTLYEGLSKLKEYRQSLESGEIVSFAQKVVQASSSRPAQPAAFVPAPDLDNQVLKMQSSIIRMMDGPHEVAAGLIVDADGLALTKASLLGNRREWSCRLFYIAGNPAIVKGRVVATSTQHDLALMKVDVKEWPIAPWSENRPIVGAIVSSPLGRSSGPVQFAVVGAEPCAELPQPNNIPIIPLSVEPDKSNTPVVKLGGRATAEFDVYRELFQPGDVITHLNGIETPTGMEFGHVMDRLTYARSQAGEVDYNTPAPGSFAGDWVLVGIRRGGEQRTICIPKVHSTNMQPLSWHANPRSLRREAFPSVFAHDGYLRPEQCGGPVVDLAGRVVGLNIARADNTRTLAIPADLLQQVLLDLRQQADIADE